MEDNLKQEIIALGKVLSGHKDNVDFLMKSILTCAKHLIECDAGTIYLLSEDGTSLEYKTVQTDGLFLDLSTADDNMPWPSLALHDEDGNKNTINASVVCVMEDRVFNVPDVHNYDGEFAFEGPKAFDDFSGYTTISMLVVPLKDTKENIIGAMQLINKKDDEGNVTSFDKDDETLALAISSQLAKTIS